MELDASRITSRDTGDPLRTQRHLARGLGRSIMRSLKGAPNSYSLLMLHELEVNHILTPINLFEAMCI